MKTYSMHRLNDKIMKEIGPIMLAHPSFDFIYNGEMTKLEIDLTKPKTDIFVITPIELSPNVPMILNQTYTTAWVSFDELGKNIGFNFNKYFYETLNGTETAFIFCHEALHVVLDHGKRGSDFMKTLPKEDVDAKILNMAMDVCINEILAKTVFEDKLDELYILDEMCNIQNCFTKKGVKVEEGKDFIYYYNEFLKMREDMQSSGGLGGGFGNHLMLGDQSENSVPDWASKLANDDGLSDSTSLEQSVQDKLSNESDEKKQANGGAGSSNKSENDDLISKQIVRLDMNDAVSRYIKPRNLSKQDMRVRAKHKYTWFGNDRRVSALKHSMKDIHVPELHLHRKDKKMRVVVYCDVSGSVSHHTQKMLSIIDLIDSERSEVISFAWADRVASVTKKDSRYEYKNAGGGTSISSVFKHFDENFKSNEVDAVVVLTDGDYSEGAIDNYIFKNLVDNTKWKFFMVRENISDRSILKGSQRIILKL